MRMSKIALMGALLGAIYAPPVHIADMQPTPKAVHSSASRARSAYRRIFKNTGNGMNGNRGLPKDIQQYLIDKAKSKRNHKGFALRYNGQTRDQGYYRVQMGSNLHRFVPLAFLNEVQS